MDIYESIFDTVNENLIQDGGKLPFSKEKYLRIVRQNPYEINIEETDAVISDSDIDAFFYRALNRLPDLNTKSSIREMEEIAEKRFPGSIGILVAMVVSGSFEFCMKHKKMLWSRETRSIKRQLYSILGWKLFKNYLKMYKSKFYQHVVFKIWDLFPNNIKNVIRRLMGRKEK